MLAQQATRLSHFLNKLQRPHKQWRRGISFSPFRSESPATVQDLNFRFASGGGREGKAFSMFAVGGIACFGCILSSGLNKEDNTQVCDSDLSSLHSKESQDVRQLVDSLQANFLLSLQGIKVPAEKFADADVDRKNATEWKSIAWKRDNGVHGGGIRYQQVDSPLFHRATINVSGVHYEDKENYPIDSATALSVILHPKHPHAPSMHFHISYVENRNKEKENYWRMIADLNPGIPNADDTKKFQSTFKYVSHLQPTLLRDALEFGNMYFYIPALRRHRGVSHLFIGNLNAKDMSKTKCKELAEDLAQKTIKVYSEIVQNAINTNPIEKLTREDYRKQFHFHTVYFFQVLTLDRGTTHGLLAHGDNDVGTLGSLPNFVSKSLLQKWLELMECNVQRKLLEEIIGVLPQEVEINGLKGSVVDDDVRGQLADVIRSHYRSNRGATSKQAKLDLSWWAEQRQKRLHLDTTKA